nr:transcription activator GAL4 binding protein [Cricetulus griseus, colon, Peptide Partial, 36 aa] [Cricetulus griseus]
GRGGPVLGWAYPGPGSASPALSRSPSEGTGTPPAAG